MRIYRHSASMLSITSWNINSVRIRLGLIKRFVEQAAPDILCLQETKTPDALFPADALRQMGFEHQAFFGQKGYHGVAVLSKQKLEEIGFERFIPGEDKRHIRVRLPDGTWLHNVYVPAGGDVADVRANPKFAEKLAFMDALTDWSRAQMRTGERAILLGDMNIAPLEHDVWSHRQLLKVVSHTPVEVEKMHTLQRASGWVDALRHFVPAEEKLYSWWSYRNRDWRKSNRGRRLDHIWLSPALKDRLAAGDILSDARGWDNPSDHAPVTVQLKATA